HDALPIFVVDKQNTNAHRAPRKAREMPESHRREVPDCLRFPKTSRVKVLVFVPAQPWYLCHVAGSIRSQPPTKQGVRTPPGRVAGGPKGYRPARYHCAVRNGLGDSSGARPEQNAGVKGGER